MTQQVSKISADSIMKMVDNRDFKTKKLVFPSAELRKNAQKTASRVNIRKLRLLGLNLVTKTVDDDKTILVEIEEYNNG